MQNICKNFEKSKKESKHAPGLELRRKDFEEPIDIASSAADDVNTNVGHSIHGLYDLYEDRTATAKNNDIFISALLSLDPGIIPEIRPTDKQ